MSGILTWEWNHITEEWVKAPACVSTIRKVASGEVIGGAHYLHWVSCNPSVAASEWELTDATAGGGDVVLDHHHPERESHNTNYVPPKYFATGIWLETFTNMTSMAFGYT